MPASILDLLLGINDNKILLLLLISVALLCLGAFIDMGALILICTPMFPPVVQAIGMGPVQFGLILMMNLGLGLATPPVGACLFVGCSTGNVRMERVLRTIWPFYLAVLTALILTTFVPAMSMTLPNLLR